ncbi:hypothetical protein J2800_001047 [Caulobacter rhizosphaerae]|uniref:DUF6680 domain-containing protein n=1 Tax=Caulobacter rhizosphaerae TaxID=2010972 RepID=A0ABU1MX63_9CAUL|nr:DUF6680 family protein [Caulobacter rhizosphaerae]MDR6530311.1 hypothetical protein [Caulobacter rhizosphaerae]
MLSKNSEGGDQTGSEALVRIRPFWHNRVMATPEPAQAMLLGITIKDAVTAILIPIIAVLTTLIYQQRQQRNDRRMMILRQLLATRHLPADPNYSAAINLIPVEFNRVKSVMAAWSEYIKEVRFRSPEGQEETHRQQVIKVQTKLITAIMKKMKLDYSEADIQADAYAADGFIVRDNLYLDSLHAARDQANAMKAIGLILAKQAELLENVTEATPTAPPVQAEATALPKPKVKPGAA